MSAAAHRADGPCAETIIFRPAELGECDVSQFTIEVEMLRATIGSHSNMMPLGGLGCFSSIGTQSRVVDFAGDGDCIRLIAMPALFDGIVRALSGVRSIETIMVETLSVVLSK